MFYWCELDRQILLTGQKLSLYNTRHNKLYF